MDSQEVGGLLEDCLRAAAAAAQHSVQPNSLCAELSTLLGEAMEMKWPFVPEKWQYKLSVSANDKTNLSDLISNHLPHLLAVLKAAIVAHEARTALAVVFIVDRFLYWKDESRRLLKITKLLHRCHPDAPVAPQLVIRLARVYLNSGKLQSAEYILSRLINNSGATGCWEYRSESDRALVQAVSIQVRGMILQKLGLWLEAAELIWASLVGYFSLPQPDKKGIGTSLGILANILLSMNDEDFHAFRTNPHIEMSLLGDGSHRLLSAAQAAKMAVVYSQYTSLYVLTNVATQGTCLLSYSFSLECPDSQRQSFLLQAREAFAIGLLTKTEGEQVSSKQELHTFIKAAYSLTVTHKWLGAPQEVVVQATQACQTALAKFYDYCHADNQEKDDLCAEIMLLVCQIKHLWQVEPFINSDVGSYIPESYRNIRDASLHFTAEGFSKVMQRFQKYHTSLCETISSNCKGTKDKINGARLCITALGTTVAALTTECSTEASSLSKGVHKEEEPQQKGSTSSAQHPAQIPEPFTTLGTGGVPKSLSHRTLRISSSSLSSSAGSQSSWEKMSLADLNSPTDRKPEPSNLLKAKTSESNKSPESDRSFIMLDCDCATSDSAQSPIPKKQPPRQDTAASSQPQPALDLNSLANMGPEMKNCQIHPPGALHLKFSKASGLWTARETCVYIGEPTGMEGKQRAAIWVQFLHQEERLSSYVGKDYLMPKEIQFHLKDVERQMTAQYYVTEFNKRLYDKDVMAQIFFIPSEALLILNGNKIVGCVTVEPYMLGDFVKLTNNKEKKNNSIQATEYGIAFGHFTYLFSNGQEVVVDLQGWVTANGKGLTYLTDPQIHSTKIPQGPSNFAARGLRYFLEEQHGPDCNGICQVLKLPPVVRQTHAVS
uniref:Alpha kinase 1 n=1 Tax=Echeneis naucrates TaxID=173247 RepID=A0A665T6W8_ECHNA